jgi:4-hydroxy-2-oxoheptanedioate aldolase
MSAQDFYFRRSTEGKLQPRESILHRKLSADLPVYCFKANIPHPVIVEIVGMTGVDCIWLDTEHFPTSVETLALLVQIARGTNTDALVRVPNGEYLFAAKVLDMGANAVMYPQVTDPDDVRELVLRTRYRPMGMRGADFGPAAGGYGMFDFDEATTWANEQVKVMIQIETPQALERIDEIASIEGISLLFIGPGDLSFTIGKRCEPDAPHVVDAMERVAATAKRHGLPWGMPALSTGHARHVLELGGRFLMQGSDSTGLSKLVEQQRAELAEVASDFGGF